MKINLLKMQIINPLINQILITKMHHYKMSKLSYQKRNLGVIHPLLIQIVILKLERDMLDISLQWVSQ